MRRLLLIPLLALVFADAAARTQLVLEDGQVLEGVDVRRDGEFYVIALDSGGSLTIPVDLVREVRLSAERERESEPPPGLTYAEPQQLAGPPVRPLRPEEGKRESEPPPGLTYAGPQQLAGPPVRPLRPEEAQAVFGEPSRFQSNVIDPTWTPESGFPEGDVLADSRSTWSESVIDPTWTPKSGFSGDDVLADSRSTWKPSPIDSTWVPEDGFKKKKLSWQRATGGVPVPARETSAATVRLTAARTLAAEPAAAPIDLAASAHGGWYEGFGATRSGVPFRFKLSAPSSRPSNAARDCGQHVLQSSIAVDVRPLEDERYTGLPLRVYRAGGAPGDDRRAAFTLEGGLCRALSGDLRDPLGVPHTRSYTMARGTEAYDAAIARAGDLHFTTDEAKIDYAVAVVSLLDPDVSGRLDAELTVLHDRDELSRLAADEAPSCSVSTAKRKKASRAALHAIRPPQVVAAGARDKVEFFTWSTADGEVVRHTVLLTAEGQVSAEHESIATHVGPHTDRK